MAATPVAARTLPSETESSQGYAFTPRVLDVGFFAALILAALCFFMASFYLYKYLASVDSLFNDLARDSSSGILRVDIANLLIHGRLVAARFSLLSCGILTGLSLGLIGFCLFLVGAKGDIQASAEARGATITFNRLAPGVLVLICAALLIGVCATHQVTFETDLAPVAPQQQQGAPAKQYLDERTDQRP